MSFCQGDCAVNKVILAGISGLALGAAAAAAYFFAMPSDEEKQLRSALIRLNEAIGQGLNVRDFVSLTVEARTKLKVAEGKMRTQKVTSAEQAVKTASVVAVIWGETHKDSCAKLFSEYREDYIEKRCREQLLEPMLAIKLIDGADTFHDLACGGLMICDSRRVISAALTKSSQALDASIKALE